jgi:hypothetical protein
MIIQLVEDVKDDPESESNTVSIYKFDIHIYVCIYVINLSEFSIFKIY